MGGEMGGEMGGGRGAMVKQRHQLFVVLLVMIDTTVIAGACFAAWALRQALMMWYVPGYRTWWPMSWENWVKEPLVIVAIPVVIYAMWAMRLYRPRRDKSIWSEQRQVIRAGLVSVVVLVVILWALGNQVFRADEQWVTSWMILGHRVDQGQVQLGFLAVLLPTMLGMERASFRLLLRALRRRGWNLRHVAIIGTGRLGQITCRTLDRNSWTGINVSYFIAHHDKTQRNKCIDRPVHGGLDDLERTLERHRVDAVYVALPSSRTTHLRDILKRLDRFPLDVRVVPDVQPRYVSQSMRVNELDGMPILSYRESPLYGLGGVFKRGLDIAGASAGLVLFSPIMLVVAVLVALSSPGPIIFKQRRVSLGGGVFKIYKFRTMRDVDDERGTPRWTERNDPRVTRVGRWLRKTSLDELPQLLNVLKGDMSLVGPRPERPELIDRFREDWRGYMLRQHVKAGITGWAQVNGLRGQTSMKKRLQYDLYYIQHWSLWLDLWILLVTPVKGFVHKNAH